MTKVLMTFFAWIAVYIIVTTTLTAAQWAGIKTPLPVQTFFLTAFLVPFMIFIIAPRAAKLAHKITG